MYSKPVQRVLALLIFFIPLAIYWYTAFPTIIWWDSSQYSAATACLGITGAPGSIILTTLGWLVLRLPFHVPAYALNLLCGTLGALAVWLAFAVFKKVISLNNPENTPARFSLWEALALLAAALMVALGITFWEYAIRYNPYILTACFTSVILLGALKWWKHAEAPDVWKYTGLLGLLVGLDFSVHRTNWVLIPGLLVFMAIRNYKVFFRPLALLAGIGGWAAGLLVQLLYIPLSLADPVLNMGETNNLPRLWDFIALKQYGGNFLANIFERQASFWDYQFMDYVKGFTDNFFHFNATGVLLAGALPTLLGLLGIVFLFKYNRRLAWALLALFIISVFTTVLYFNLPPNYFRSIYRHYMPTLVVFSVFIFCGAYYGIQLLYKLPKSRRLVGIGLFLFILFVAPLAQGLANLQERNGRGNTFTRDMAHNMMQSLDKNAILLTYSDHDYFPELYAQIAEGERPDLVFLNVSLLNADWYLRQQKRHHPDVIGTDGVDISQFMFTDSIPRHTLIPLSNAVQSEYHTSRSTLSLTLANLRDSGHYNLLQDVMLFNIIKHNRWKRPIYLPVHGLEPEIAGWLQPYLRYEGLVYRLMPDTGEQVATERIAQRLKTFALQKFNDPHVMLDEDSQILAGYYYYMFLTLADEYIKQGRKAEAGQVMTQMHRQLPFSRLKPGQGLVQESLRLEGLLKG